MDSKTASGREATLDVLIGETFDEVVFGSHRDRNGKPETIEFRRAGEAIFNLSHEQDCCEEVFIEDVVGDLEWLARTPVLDARMETNREDPPPSGFVVDEYFTWTFFRLSTIKGTVVIRFLGSSNGYYGEDAALHYA